MKKTFTAFALALALSIVVAPESSAAIKVGASCKKAGLTSITGGLKYTCVKKSGKLVWGKGVAVKASAKPTVTPTSQLQVLHQLRVQVRHRNQVLRRLRLQRLLRVTQWRR
jgi:hypothetical protein